MAINSFEDLFRRYGLHFSDEDSSDEKISSFQKLYFYLNEEVSLIKKNENKVNWVKQIKKGVGQGHHPLNLNK